MCQVLTTQLQEVLIDFLPPTHALKSSVAHILPTCLSILVSNFVLFCFHDDCHVVRRLSLIKSEHIKLKMQMAEAVTSASFLIPKIQHYDILYV